MTSQDCHKRHNLAVGENDNPINTNDLYQRYNGVTGDSHPLFADALKAFFLHSMLGLKALAPGGSQTPVVSNEQAFNYSLGFATA